MNDSAIPDDLQTAVSRGLRLAGFSFTVDTMLTVAREIQGLMTRNEPEPPIRESPTFHTFGSADNWYRPPSSYAPASPPIEYVFPSVNPTMQVMVPA